VLEVKKCEERFGERWVEEWLRRRGMRLDQYVLPGSLDRKQHTEKELVTTA
jgi:hypothetical protein